MRPSPFHEAMEHARHHGEARRHAHERALRETRPARLSVLTRLEAAIMRVARRDHALTDFPCHLPDGSTGRIAVILQDGSYALVCRIA